jgi:hypothetical protein
MAAFTQQDESGNRLDWKILRDGSIALYWRREFLDGDINWFHQENYQVFLFDCGRWATSEEMYADFERTLAFPTYFGRNLDALDDSLGDLPVPDVGGIAFALTHFDAYAKGAGAALLPSGRPEAEIVLDILAGTSRNFLLTGRRFLTLVHTDDPHARFDSLGCVSARWNQREWLNKNRGL